MKKYLYILFFYCISVNAQMMQKGQFNLPVSDDSLVLYYSSKALAWNNLTYNSTGNLVYPASDTSYTAGSSTPDSGLVHRIGTSSSNREYVVYDDSDPVILDRHLQGVVDGDEIFRASVDTMTDLSGNDNNAVQTTGTKQPSLLNYSMSYDGTDDVINAGDIEMSWTEITVSVWIQTVDTTDDQERIVSKDYVGTACNFIVKYTDYEEGAWEWSVRDNGSWVTCRWSSISIVDGKWHHIVATMKGNDSVTLWIDNDNKHQLPFSSSTLDDSDNASLTIGAESNENGTFFNGLIDNVFVFKRKVTDTEIRQLYNYTRP